MHASTHNFHIMNRASKRKSGTFPSSSSSLSSSSNKLMGGSLSTRSILLSVGLGTVFGAVALFLYVSWFAPFSSSSSQRVLRSTSAGSFVDATGQYSRSAYSDSVARDPRFNDLGVREAEVFARGLDSSRRMISTQRIDRAQNNPGDHTMGDHNEESTVYTGRRAVSVYFECCERHRNYLNELSWLHASWEFVTGRIHSKAAHPNLVKEYARRRQAHKWLSDWELADAEEFGVDGGHQPTTTQIDLIVFTNRASLPNIPADWGCVVYPDPLPDHREANCRIIVEGTGWRGGDPFLHMSKYHHQHPADVDNLSPFVRRRENAKQQEHLHHYRFSRSIEFFMWPEARLLDGYDKVLKTDLDTFLTPRFATWIPKGFTVSSSSPSAAYGCMEYTTDRLRNISRSLGLFHRGISGIGLTWYGNGRMVRRVGALATALTLYIHSTQWTQPDDPQEWAKWHQGVASMYGSELAINHLVPDLHVVPAGLIDVSTADFDRSVLDVAHLHTFQTGDFFSKEAFHRGQYNNVSVHGFNNQLPAVYALQMAQRGNGLRNRFEDMHFIPVTIKDLQPSMRDPDRQALKLKV